MLKHRKWQLVAGAVAAGAAALALTVPALATGGYTDATGDGAGAPDIGRIDVASDVAGQVLFTVNVDNWPTGGDVRLVLFLDTDMNADTGAPDTYGAEYAFGVMEAENAYAFGVWNGSDWAETPSSTVRVDSTTKGVTISVNRSELGNTGEFNFWARTLTGDASASQLDDAPDDGVWNYSLAASGPDILGVMVAMSPLLGPAAGKSFAITSVNLRLPPSGEPVSILPSPERYSCTATLAGRRLAGTGKGACSWVLPKKARGKRFVVTVTVNYQGATKSIPFSFKVR